MNHNKLLHFFRLRNLFLLSPLITLLLHVLFFTENCWQIIKKFDYFEILIIDDISYVPYSREETDVLFTLLAERYEMRSVLITSNLVFAKWNTIFKDNMTTSAAIDRLVHHSTILELNTESYRIATAKEKKLTVKSEDIM